MKKPIAYCWLLATGLAFGGGRPVAAQEEKKVYTYVEQMPQLPGGGGQGAILAAIQKNFRYPPDALRDHVGGRIFLQFVVGTAGQVEDAKVIKGLTPSTDAAALDAVRRLPAFVPGKQNGRAVAVSFTIPLLLDLSRDLSSPSPSVTVKGNTDADLAELSGVPGRVVVDEVVEQKVYTYVEQMPQLPGGGGNPAIVAAVQQRLVVPADAQEGRVFASFTVGPQGAVTDARIVKGLGPSTDAAVLAAVGKLPTFVPGKQNGRVVSVSYTVPVSIFLPNHVFEVREVAARARFPQPGLFPYLQRNLHVPAVVATEKLRGRVGVDFVVLASGKVDSPALTSHVCSSCDEEVLRLVKGFPAWLPARDVAGKAVAVRQHLDVPLPLPDPRAPYTKPGKVNTYATEMPTLLDGLPVKELGALLTETIRYPETARREKIVGTAQVEFTVAVDGTVRDVRLVQSVCSSCDQAVLDALAAVGPLVPGRQGEQAVPVQLQVSVPFNPTPATATPPAKRASPR